MTPNDNWKPATITLKSGRQIKVLKGEPIDNREWRQGVANYEMQHGLPVSVYSKDLNLQTQTGN